MSQEDKELLLKDLCARLPSGVRMLHDFDKRFDTGLICQPAGLIKFNGETCILAFGVADPMPLDEVKLYLRPMSSMTEEEETLFRCELPAIAKTDAQLVVMRMELFLKGHLDFNHLIDKGLALEAPEGMYETE